ncbi:MAG: gamma-glutamyl-gamma-aminobutyrate hydrolase family protein [Bacteroidota bacterium]
MRPTFRHLSFLLIICLTVIYLTSCRDDSNIIRVAVSKASPNYINWLKKNCPDIQIVNLFNLNVNVAAEEIRKCDGLLLTGGEDVYPGWYGKENESPRCTGFNLRRDSLEMAVLSSALDLKMPVFGICRGNQLINVYLGGKLIVDIPTDYGQKVTHMCRDYRYCFHEVYIQRNSRLYEVVATDSASVTTNHHQAVDFLSPLLTVCARSSDGLIEAVEWLNPEGKNFLLGVQWHPERMDNGNPLCGKLAMTFISECEAYKKSRKKI